ncbi:hypothetical protein K432DRAFT_194025 [Lepidopterella palustris CBS 459.81]|uniref:Uncharacterized protein n=1 Tax=Lepidopterella palustris CBS 459.81 TaxID=1314670 RepID=A0A8E2JHS3_9PEZI|nr:hypothetical protein K432DRAFT_194025 [Lepidopterella palustris CBS 459.81]
MQETGQLRARGARKGFNCPYHQIDSGPVEGRQADPLLATCVPETLLAISHATNYKEKGLHDQPQGWMKKQSNCGETGSRPATMVVLPATHQGHRPPRGAVAGGEVTMPALMPGTLGTDRKSSWPLSRDGVGSAALRARELLTRCSLRVETAALVFGAAEPTALYLSLPLCRTGMPWPC